MPKKITSFSARESTEIQGKDRQGKERLRKRNEEQNKREPTCMRN